MKCSVVIPVYRSEQSLDFLIERLAAVLPNVCEIYEVVLVNDGSPDNSWGVIERLAKQNPWVRGINLMKNYGQHNATLCGIRAARYEVIFVMDDDLQNPPEEMPKLLAKLNEGCDVVYGVSRKRQQGWFKSLVSAFLKRAIACIMGQHACATSALLKSSAPTCGNRLTLSTVPMCWWMFYFRGGRIVSLR